jgi:hypothetical protein
MRGRGLARPCVTIIVDRGTIEECDMENEFLTIRLSSEDAQVMRKLRAATGLSKTEIVKRALRSLASGGAGSVEGSGLYELGAARFGRFGDDRRQSADIKRIARSRAGVKRPRR